MGLCCLWPLGHEHILREALSMVGLSVSEEAESLWLSIWLGSFGVRGA